MLRTVYIIYTSYLYLYHKYFVIDVYYIAPFLLQKTITWYLSQDFWAELRHFRMRGTSRYPNFKRNSFASASRIWIPGRKTKIRITPDDPWSIDRHWLLLSEYSGGETRATNLTRIRQVHIGLDPIAISRVSRPPGYSPIGERNWTFRKLPLPLLVRPSPSFVATRSIRPREQRPASPNSSGAGKGDPGGFRVVGALRGFILHPPPSALLTRENRWLP